MKKNQYLLAGILVIFGCNDSSKMQEELNEAHKNLSLSGQSIAARNLRIFNQLNFDYKCDSAGVGPWKEKADGLRTRADSVLVVLNDGFKDNETVITNAFTRFQNHCLSLFHPADTVRYPELIESISAPFIFSGDKVALPIFDSVLVAKTRNDVWLMERKTLQYLYSKVGGCNMWFKVEAVVQEKANVVNKGDYYEAEVFMGAYQTNPKPIAVVKDKELPIENGKGIYRVPTDSVGRFLWEGSIFIVNPISYDLEEYKFEQEYQVAEIDCE